MRGRFKRSDTDTLLTLGNYHKVVLQNIWERGMLFSVKNLFQSYLPESLSDLLGMKGCG